jgi:hypothetical protein
MTETNAPSVGRCSLATISKATWLHSTPVLNVRFVVGVAIYQTFKSMSRATPLVNTQLVNTLLALSIVVAGSNDHANRQNQV